MTTKTDNPTTTKTSDADVLFNPGHIDVTASVLKAMKQNHCLPIQLLARHLTGDWGVVDEEQAKANHQGLNSGERIHSRYPLSEGCFIGITTEWNLPVTTFILHKES